MPFPTNPNDGDIFTADTGIRYEYSSVEDSWTIVDAYTLYGQTGSQGETGAQGETGSGLQGETGIRGETGILGVGETGSQGETGIAGIQGDTGIQGEIGPQGNKGDTGIQGETGIQGVTGLDASGTTSRFVFQAADFDNPSNSDWVVNSLAPASADSNNAAVTVRRFDDTTEEGVGFMVTIPLSTQSLKFYFKSRAESSPGSTQSVVPRFYYRDLNNNEAVGSWVTGADFNALSFPTNENWQYDDQTLTLGTLGLTGGELVQFELIRDVGNGSDDLSGDWTLGELIIEPI